MRKEGGDPGFRCRCAAFCCGGGDAGAGPRWWADHRGRTSVQDRRSAFPFSILHRQNVQTSKHQHLPYMATTWAPERRRTAKATNWTIESAGQRDAKGASHGEISPAAGRAVPIRCEMSKIFANRCG